MSNRASGPSGTGPRRARAAEPTGTRWTKADDEPARSVATEQQPRKRPAATPRRVDTSLFSYDELPLELAEALRAIVNRYELRQGTSLPGTIAFTSALRGEGVTTVSQAMATLIAQETGRFVCWVDCSWLGPEPSPASADRPDLIEILGRPEGVASAFATAPDLDELYTLRAGPLPEARRNSIVRSSQFDRVLDELTSEFDHVIFDIPPVLTNAGGLALVRRSDASMFVVRQRTTSMNQFNRLVEATQPTPNVGVVLNRYKTSIPSRLRRLLEG